MKPIFAIYENGVSTMDEPKLKKMAEGRDAMQPFFATAILDLVAKLQRGELKGVAPGELFIGIVKKT